MPAAIGQSLEQARQGEISILILLGILVLAAVVIYLVVFIERGQRRITVNYAKRQQGRRMMQAQASHLPLKVNMAGVIPAIFASSILLFPASVAQWFGSGDSSDWLQDLAVAIGPGQPLNILLFTGFIVFFCFFYTALMFNPQEVADNLKRSGAFVPGIRPGQQTANYIDGVLTRLTVFGSAYIALVCLLPQFLVVMFNVPFYLGGTSMLIVVVVVMDFMAQVQSHLIGEDAFQETDMVGISRPIVKHSFMVQRTEDIPSIIKKAFYIGDSRDIPPLPKNATEKQKAKWKALVERKFGPEFKKLPDLKAIYDAPEPEVRKRETNLISEKLALRNNRLAPPVE